MKKRTSTIQLVTTVALRKELPLRWLNAHAVPVHTLAALKSGTLNKRSDRQSGVLVVVTGVGLKAGKEAACWIRDHINPLFVVNVGACGVTDKRRSLARWIKPEYVCNEEDDQFAIDSRFPFPLPDRTIPVDSLLSVTKAKPDRLPEPWKKHDAVDMECFAQAQVFSKTNISFHCLKFGTDYSDEKAMDVFHQNLEILAQEVKTLLKHLAPPRFFADRSTPDNRITITVIIPVYNREQTIVRAVDSVLAQSYAPAEVIVVNDRSTDTTGDILSGYGDSVTVLSLPVNSGPSKARNAGITRAKTEWVAFLDSDDCWKPDKLKKQVEFLKRYPFYQILQSDEIWIRNEKRVNPRKHHTKPEGWIWEASLQRCLVSPSGVLLRKSLLMKYGNFDETLPVCEDYDLWLKISRHHPVGLEPGLRVIKYGGHKDQLSRTYPAIDRFRVQSLFRLLLQEEHPYFRKKIITVLRKKLKILLQGYEKRGKRGETDECRRMLEALGPDYS